ncbi:MAG: nitroreductase family protein [Candidatus Omnitrophica bacterium]|nr:nitroreductase family protein [Candidatus Omnitrophota bacterium]
MDILDTLKKRRSIRTYQDREIPKDALKQIIDVARFSPTARNEQPWEFIVITDSRIFSKIAKLGDNARFVAYAKACIVVFCADTKYYLEDGCAATTNILNAAAALGIGSCWVAGDKKPYCEEVAALLGVPPELKLVSMVALGYPADPSDFKLGFKKSLRGMLHWEKF